MATAPSVDNKILFGGEFHTPNTNTQKMNRKNITEQRNNADTVGHCSDVEGYAMFFLLICRILVVDT